MTILGIAGSLRRESYNKRLLRAAKELMPSIDIYDGLASIPMFNEDIESDDPQPVCDLRRRALTARGLLFVTPEYNNSYPAALKNAIDWLSRPPSVLSGKPAAIIGATTGRFGTVSAQNALQQLLFATEVIVMPSPSLLLRDAASAFDDSGRFIDADAHQRLANLLNAFDEWIQRFVRVDARALS